VLLFRCLDGGEVLLNDDGAATGSMTSRAGRVRRGGLARAVVVLRLLNEGLRLDVIALDLAAAVHMDLDDAGVGLDVDIELGEALERVAVGGGRGAALGAGGRGLGRFDGAPDVGLRSGSLDLEQQMRLVVHRNGQRLAVHPNQLRNAAAVQRGALTSSGTGQSRGTECTCSGRP
jgi:hypothetical protein